MLSEQRVAERRDRANGSVVWVLEQPAEGPYGEQADRNRDNDPNDTSGRTRDRGRQSS